MDADALSQNRSAFVQRLTQATWLLIVLSAVALRIRGIGRPFWLDEAWVANSALASSLRDSFQYDTWLQTNPPMFVMAIRIAHKLFGGYEIPFRAVPFAFSVATVVLALHLGKRLFGPVFGLFLGAILAVSPILISLSLQLKQYSSDVFCAVLLMILIWNYSRSSTQRNYVRLSIASLVCLPLAYTTVMFLPPAGIALLGNDTDRRTTMLRTATFALLCSAVLLTLQFVFIKPNQSLELVAYWHSQNAFPPNGHANYGFYIHAFRDVFYMFYPRSRFLSRLFGVLAICGFTNLLWSIQSARSRVLLALACLPIIALLVLNRFHLYPFYSEKQDVFIFPCLAALIVWGAKKIAELLARNGRRRIIVETLSILICAVATMTAFWLDWRNPPAFNSEDPAAAVRFLERTVNPGDLVYVHASAEEQIKLYLRLFDVHDMPVVFGNTGWPCCTRHHQFETGPVADSYVMRDFQNKIGEARPERILLVFGDRTAQWDWLGRNERQILLRHVQDMSCQTVDTHQAGSIVTDDLRCDARRR
jgi:4-amino-4-deoxy-L-arabinose transferase-like glycosyltransferase